MKANELMLGDWVSYKGKMPCKITAICKDTVVVDNDTAQDWMIDYDKLTPIPLTGEILKKNGFKKMDGEYQDVFYYYERLELLIDDRLEPCGYTLYGVFGFQIKYVHELQHAMKLRGIEKEIQL